MARTGRRGAAGLAILLASAAHAFAEEPPLLELPVACEVGRDCAIQNYVDADPSASAKDYECGSLSYEGHNGTDFRLPTTAAQQSGVDVLAAADGRVLRRRDGMADISVREAGAPSVDGSECGNAVILGHGDGWETQYCHLARGSLRVDVGDLVKARQAIGRVGLSGQTEYPHLHFILRHRGQVADPFAFAAAPGSCGGGRNLWQPALHAALAYRPRLVLNAGFASRSVTMATLESGEAERDRPGSEAAALVAYVRGIGLKAGDVQSLVVTSPSGQAVAENRARPMERNQAQTMIFAGIRRPPSGWDRGAYQARYTVRHDDKAVLERHFSIELQ